MGSSILGPDGPRRLSWKLWKRGVDSTAAFGSSNCRRVAEADSNRLTPLYSLLWFVLHLPGQR